MGQVLLVVVLGFSPKGKKVIKKNQRNFLIKDEKPLTPFQKVL